MKIGDIIALLNDPEDNKPEANWRSERDGLRAENSKGYPLSMVSNVDISDCLVAYILCMNGVVDGYRLCILIKFTVPAEWASP